MNDSVTYSITCHCGAAAQTVTTVSSWADIDICHCRSCRHTTGVLCTSYVRIHGPPSLQGLESYAFPTHCERYFCGTCGCHIFFHNDDEDSIWSVATGVIIGIAENEEAGQADTKSETDAGLRFTRHVNVQGTKDGGLSPFLREVDRRGMDVEEPSFPGHYDSLNSQRQTSPEAIDQEPHLKGSCQCKGILLHITRPDESSRLPHSGYSDLIVPFCTGSPRIVNPDDEKWWLRPANATNPTKYLAGTCACRSCRLISGFEIQTWAFVPRSNIFMHGEGGDEQLPLDFAHLPSGTLRSYESSPGVLREFCRRCGATVFWHDKWRPDLIDVSVGLLAAPEGARADSWLDWFTERVSFSELTVDGRTGIVAKTAKDLIDSLERGLKDWGLGKA